MGSVHSAGLSQAIVVSGGCTSTERKMVRGGWVWAWWMISDVQVYYKDADEGPHWAKKGTHSK